MKIEHTTMKKIVFGKGVRITFCFRKCLTLTPSKSLTIYITGFFFLGGGHRFRKWPVSGIVPEAGPVSSGIQPGQTISEISITDG